MATILDDASFRLASEIDLIVPDHFGVYAVRLALGSTCPEPFETMLSSRRTRLVYIGKATSLKKRMLIGWLAGRTSQQVQLQLSETRSQRYRISR